MLKHLLRGGSGIQGGSWVIILDGSKSESNNSVAIGPDGSVYICGTTQSAGAGSNDLLLAKFDSSGALQWQKTLGGSSNDIGHSVAVAPDGSVYVCGQTASAGAGKSDLLLAKFSSSGTLQWQKTLGGNSVDYGERIVVAPDGSVYVSGTTQSAGAGSKDLLLAKFDSSGALQWQKTLGGDEIDGDTSVAIGPDGSVYICGTTNSIIFAHTVLLLAKFDSSGALQWQKFFVRSKDDTRGRSIAIGPDGSVYVCGYVYFSRYVYYDLLLVKFDSSGALQWQKVLSGNDDDRGTSVAIGPDGSVYVGGYTSSAGVSYSAALFAKISDDVINKASVVYGDFTLRDITLTANDAALSFNTAGLSLANSSLSVSTAYLTIADANYISKKYEGE